jgi:putative addiction module killer protein
MLIIKTTPEFDRWLAGIRDRMVVQRLNARLRKATLGNLGDVKPVGGGVFEMREHFGPGWRMYYARHGEVVVLMLGGGVKSTQAADIARAVKMAATMED